MRTLLVDKLRVFDSEIAIGLQTGGNVVDRIGDLGVTLERCGSNKYDLIIIDLDGLQMNGCDLVKKIRISQIESPVFIIGEKYDVEQKILLLDIGADDFLVKPVDIREVLAKARSVTRRNRCINGDTTRVGNLLIDSLTRSVSIQDELISLTPREYRLLELLIARINQVLPKERLMKQLFGYDDDVSPNALELYVSRIRHKLRFATVRIETVHCVGYIAKVVL